MLHERCFGTKAYSFFRRRVGARRARRAGLAPRGPLVVLFQRERRGKPSSRAVDWARDLLARDRLGQDPMSALPEWWTRHQLEGAAQADGTRSARTSTTKSIVVCGSS